MAKQRLTDRTLTNSVGLYDLIHIVKTGDTSQNPAGSSYKATVESIVATLSASTVTGLTFNNFTYDLTLSLDNGNTFTDNLGILASDIKVTGGTYNSSTGDITFTNNSGGTFVVSGVTFTGNTSASCITDLYVSNLYGCSPITIHSSVQSIGSSSSGITSLAFGSNVNASGDYSHAEGVNTTASGIGAHSEGNGTNASGNYSRAYGFETLVNSSYSIAEGYQTSATTSSASHAEGYKTTASGLASHAEGSQTTSFGQYSHAEGVETTASGNYSHAEGYQTNSAGQGSHAEGQGTTASNTYAHAEGQNTNASGYASHSEGYGTIASGDGSHAEGFQTTASGYFSHTEGLGTVASGDYQHVSGKWNVTGDTTVGAFIVGNGINSSNRSNLIFAGGNIVNISGKTITTNFQMTSGGTNNYVLTSDANGNASWQSPLVTGDTNFANTDLILSGNRNHDLNGNEMYIYDSLGLDGLGSNISFYSLVDPRVAISYGYYLNSVSLDIGEYNGNTGFTFTTQGLERMRLNNNGNLGIGTNSPSEILDVSGNTKISGTLNIGTIGAGSAIFNLGLDSNGYVVSGVTFTGNTSASCITDLYVSNLYGCSPITIWDSIQSSGSISSGATSFAFGVNNLGSGIASFVEGANNISSGDAAHAEGIQTTAIGVASHAEGGGTIAIGLQSHAEGKDTQAVGDYSHSEGANTIANGYASHAGGAVTTSNGYYSFVHGFNSVALSANTIVFGENITGTSSNTVYVDNLNIKTIGSGTSVINLGLDSNGYVVTGTTGGGSFTGNTSATCITDIYVTNIYGCSPLHIEPSGLNDVYLVENGGNVGIGTTTPNYKLDVIGETRLSGFGQNVLRIIGSGDTAPLFTVQGSSGELFTITDSLVGELFSVNNISGLPVVRVFDNDTILLGNYQSPSLNSAIKVNPSIGLSTVYTLPMSAYTGAWFEYTVKNSGGARSGQIMSIFSGNTVNFTETTTLDIGSTTPITFNMTANGTNASLEVSATTSGWEVKTIIRSI